MRAMTILNRIMTAVFDVVFAPFERAPGWLSLTVFAALTGAAGLLVYKYTSNQNEIKRTKAQIKAAILAIKLFKDDLGVIATSLGRVMWGATKMLRYALWPMLIMFVPFVLVMAQLGIRYQWRPLATAERTVLTAQMADSVDVTAAEITLEVPEGLVIDAPPVRIPRESRIVWRLRAMKEGDYRVNVRVGDETMVKTVKVGTTFMGANAIRSRGDFWSAVLYPAEAALPQESLFRSIRVDYAERESMIHGANWWLVWLIGLSFVFAFLLKPVLRVEF